MRKKVRFSEAVLASLTCPAGVRRLRVRDTQLSGFLVELTPKGLRFVVRCDGGYQPLGEWPALDLDEARILALEMLRRSQLRQLKERRPELHSMIVEGDALDSASGPIALPKKSPTLRVALAEYLSVKTLRPTTVKSYESNLNCYWRDYLGKPLTALTPDAVLERFRSIKSPAGANSSLRIIRALFRFYNAAHDASLTVPTAKTLALQGARRVLPKSRVIQDSEQAGWYRAVQKHAGPTCRGLFPFIALTGLRLGEALQLTWKDIDLETLVLTVPQTKNGRPHTIPVGRHAAAIIEASKPKKVLPSGVVFPVNQRNQRKALAKVVAAYPVEWSAHDLRRGFATTATRLLISDRIVKRLMNHTEGDVTGKHYIHLGPDALRPHTQAIEDALWALWQGQPFPQPK